MEQHRGRHAAGPSRRSSSLVNTPDWPVPAMAMAPSTCDGPGGSLAKAQVMTATPSGRAGRQRLCGPERAAGLAGVGVAVHGGLGAGPVALPRGGTIRAARTPIAASARRPLGQHGVGDLLGVGRPVLDQGPMPEQQLVAHLLLLDLRERRMFMATKNGHQDAEDEAGSARRASPTPRGDDDRQDLGDARPRPLVTRSSSESGTLPPSRGRIGSRLSTDQPTLIQDTWLQDRRPVGRGDRPLDCSHRRREPDQDQRRERPGQAHDDVSAG